VRGEGVGVGVGEGEGEGEGPIFGGARGDHSPRLASG